MVKQQHETYLQRLIIKAPRATQQRQKNFQQENIKQINMVSRCSQRTWNTIYIWSAASCTNSHCVLLAIIYYRLQFSYRSYSTVTFTKSLALIHQACVDIIWIKKNTLRASAVAYTAAIINVTDTEETQSHNTLPWTFKDVVTVSVALKKIVAAYFVMYKLHLSGQLETPMLKVVMQNQRDFMEVIPLCIYL